MSIRPSARRPLSPIEDPERLLSRRNRSETSLLFNLEEDDMAGQAPPQGAARTWLEKEPPNSITTWNNLVSKFIDTFYNSSNQSEQDSLNSAANGNFLTNNTQEALTIIENKSKVQTSRNKPQVLCASGSSTQDAHVIALTKQVETFLSAMNRPVNSIQNGCETCGGPHAYYECQVAGCYTQEDVYATTGTYNAGGNSYQPQGNRNLLSYRSNNYHGPPGFNNQNKNTHNQNQNRYNQGSQNQGYNQNRGQNYNQGINYNQNQGYNQNQAQPNVPSLEEMMNGLTAAEPSIPPPVPPTPRVEVKKEPKTLMDEVHITSPGSTTHVPPPAFQPMSPPKPKEDPKPNPHQPKIPYPSRLNKTKLLAKNDV
ncbi:hypothetical protein Tco_0615577 [Tanacetum coccineum]